MINDIHADLETRMNKSLDSLRQELSRVRTGRANTGLLEPIQVPYYGSDVPLSQVANISVEDSRTLGVTPWEKNMVPVVEKAILNANLGLNPVAAGQVIRIPLPPLTEDRRKDLARLVRHEAETVRVAIRNIRRDGIHELKNLVKEKMISEDEEKRAQEAIQKLTDRFVHQVEGIVSKKEEELMAV